MDLLLCELYEEYTNRRLHGVSRKDAKNFVNLETIQSISKPDWTLEDIEDICRELSRNNLMNCKWANNIVFGCSLSDTGIAYIEAVHKGKREAVKKRIAELIPVVLSNIGTAMTTIV